VNNRCKFSPYFALISHSYEANVTGQRTQRIPKWGDALDSFGWFIRDL
jgi:hypothetical protein